MSDHLFDAMRRPRVRVLAWLLLGLAACWLLRPALRPAHVEGFSASIESLALHMSQDDVRAYDQLHPLDVDYFDLTRLGVNATVYFFIDAFGLDSTTALRVTMWLGLLALVSGSLTLIRTWAECDWLLAAVVLLLIPGVLDSTYFYNDNVLSAGVGLCALVLLTTLSGIWSACAAGVLLAFAVLCRTDLVLIIPAVPIILMRRSGVNREFWIRGLACGLAVSIVVILGLAAANSNPLKVLHATTQVVQLWNRGLSVKTQFKELALYTGLPILLLLPVGVAALVLAKRWRLLALLTVTPFLFNVAEFGKMWEARQLLPLTPFVGALGALGFRSISALGPLRMRQSVLVIYLVIVVLTLSIRPNPPFLDDGPRNYVGRLWSPPVWRRWQDSVESDFRSVDALIRSAPEGQRIALVTEDWNPDRYVHLALQRAGMREVTPENTDPACRKAGEVFESAGRIILHIRQHEPIVKAQKALLLDRLDRISTPCLIASNPVRVYLVASRERKESIQRWAAPPVDLAEAATHGLALTSQGPFAIYLATPRIQDSLRAQYQTDKDMFWAENAASPPAVRTLDEAEAYLARP